MRFRPLPISRYSFGMTDLRWQWCTLHELTPAELYALLAARAAVFVVEQNCAYQDADGYDLDAQHLIAWSGAEVAACLRVLSPGTKLAERSIGRIITSSAFRGTGLGRTILKRALERLDAAYPGKPVRIGAQARLAKFYEDFGFQSASEVYMEDGIPHIYMLRAARPAPPRGSSAP
jgi:ElaA protein